MTIQDHTKRVSFSAEVSLDQIPYGNGRVGGLVTNAQNAFDYVFAHLFPNYIGTFATPAALPGTANVNDYAFVTDDGDGKSAGYVWVEIDAVESWQKKYDVDYNFDGILSDLLAQTSPLYVSVTGKPGGQRLAGGSNTGDNLELEANSDDDTGLIIFHNSLQPSTDNTEDVGALANRIKDLYLAGALSDGTNTITVDEGKQAYDHISRTDNPHSVNYDQLALRIGTVTVNGDATGSVDLGSSGSKTLTIAVVDDSHNHTSSTITDFDTATYTKVASILQDNDIVTYTKDGGSETIRPTISSITTARIDDIQSPTATDRVVISNGSEYREGRIDVELTGEVSGTGSYSTVDEKIDITNTVVETASIKSITEIDTENLQATIAIGNPAQVFASNHKLQDGMSVYVKSETTVPSIDGEFTVTLVDNDNFTIPVNVTGAGTGFYIPNNAQFLYDSSSGTFKVRREFEEVTHTELGDVDLNDDHLQYVRKDGRSGGQAIHGSTQASGNLELDSTVDATKGNIIFKSVPIGDGDNVTDLGTQTVRYKDLFMAGEGKGFRIENLTAEPPVLGGEQGRIILDTINDKVLYNNGIKFKPLAAGLSPRRLENFANVTTKTINLATELEDTNSSDYLWTLTDPTTNEIYHVQIEATAAKEVTVTSEFPLSGNINLVGI